MATNNATNTPALTLNGQLLIGSTGANPVAATLTAGSNVTITNAAGSITIASTAGAGGRLLNVQYLTASSGTYTPTVGTVSCLVVAVAGGGGGGAVPNGISVGYYAAGSGGGGGAMGQKFYSTPPTSAPYTVGAGGSGGTYSPVVNAGSGGNTTFNTTDIVVTGGVGGVEGFGNNSQEINAGSNGGVAGAGNASDLVQPGQPGWFGYTTISGTGGASGLGSGGALCVHANSGVAVAGNNATGYGGGGSGAATPSSFGANGGNGASGIIIVYEYS